MVADSLQGIDKQNILQVNEVAPAQLSQTNLEAAFSGTAYDHLKAILNGQYVSTNSKGATLPSIAGSNTGASPGSLWYDNGNVKFYDGANVKTLSTTGGSVSLSSGVTGTLPLANGGTGGSLTANNGGIVYSTASTLAILGPGTSGKVLTSNGSSAPGWADPVDATRVAKSGDTMSGVLTLPDNGLTIGSSPFIMANGNVGIGTTSPGNNTRLYAQGQIVAKDFDNGSSGTFDFANGNASESTFDCASSMTLANLRRGGSYTIVIKGSGSAQCQFSPTVTGDDAGTVSYRFAPLNGTRTLNTHTLYNLSRIGNTVYVQWVSGF
jgi:hypothetical protein